MSRPWHHRFDVAVRECRLPYAEKLVLLVLNTHSDSRGLVPQRFAPSMTRLANETSLSRRKVVSAVAECERLGWLVVDRPPVELQRREHAKNAYRLLIPHGCDPDSSAEAGAPHAPALVHDVPQAGAPDALKSAATNTRSTGSAATPSPRAATTAPSAAFAALLADAGCTEHPAVVWSLMSETIRDPMTYIEALDANDTLGHYLDRNDWIDWAALVNDDGRSATPMDTSRKEPNQ